eukprot:6180193-Ditylum_brightwellii.AAC.1
MVKELHVPHQAGTSTPTLSSRYTSQKPMDATSKIQQKTSHKKGTQICLLTIKQCNIMAENTTTMRKL